MDKSSHLINSQIIDSIISSIICDSHENFFLSIILLWPQTLRLNLLNPIGLLSIKVDRFHLDSHPTPIMDNCCQHPLQGLNKAMFMYQLNSSSLTTSNRAIIDQRIIYTTTTSRRSLMIEQKSK